MANEGGQVRLTLTERYIRVTAVANLLDVHRTTVDALIADGELESARFGPKGGATKVTESSLVAFLERRGIKFKITADGVAITPPSCESTPT